MLSISSQTLPTRPQRVANKRRARPPLANRASQPALHRRPQLPQPCHSGGPRGGHSAHRRRVGRGAMVIGRLLAPLPPPPLPLAVGNGTVSRRRPPPSCVDGASTAFTGRPAPPPLPSPLQPPTPPPPRRVRARARRALCRRHLLPLLAGVGRRATARARWGGGVRVEARRHGGVAPLGGGCTLFLQTKYPPPSADAPGAHSHAATAAAPHACRLPPSPPPPPPHEAIWGGGRE